MVELVVVIVVSAIVVTFMSMFLVAPVDGYVSQERRTELSDSAGNAVRMLDNDIHNAVPESVRFVRNGSIVTLELLRAVDVARYRKSGSAGGPAEELDFNVADDQFDTLGAFANLAHPSPIAYLIVGHTGLPAQDAYAMANVITPQATAITVDVSPTPEEDLVRLSIGAVFTNPSPSGKVFAVSGPVAYVCNETARTLTRFANYPITAGIAAQAGAVAGSVVARDITSCAITYAAGTPQRGGLVMLQLIFSRDGETVRMMHQSRVENVP